jgi:hypothetical protein
MMVVIVRGSRIKVPQKKPGHGIGQYELFAG